MDDVERIKGKEYSMKLVRRYGFYLVFQVEDDLLVTNIIALTSAVIFFFMDWNCQQTGWLIHQKADKKVVPGKFHGVEDTNTLGLYTLLPTVLLLNAHRPYYFWTTGIVCGLLISIYGYAYFKSSNQLKKAGVEIGQNDSIRVMWIPKVTFHYFLKTFNVRKGIIAILFWGSAFTVALTQSLLLFMIAAICMVVTEWLIIFKYLIKIDIPFTAAYFRYRVS
ncbi:hypothetical protein ACRYI5_09285 [Furfurilactobacillus sp. WILCCON 0119]